MRIRNARDLGLYVREQRLARGQSQSDLAALALVSRRWLSDLERGKATAEIGLVFKVIAALGTMVEVGPLPHQDLDLDEYLDSLGRGTR